MTDDLLKEDLGSQWDIPKYALSACVYAERDGKILLLRRAAESAFAGQWFLPGGGVDPGESPQEAAHRELREESGLEMTEEPEAVGCYLMHMYGHDFLQISFRAPVSGEVTLSHEHDGAQWTDPRDMRAFMTDERLLKIARGNEQIAKWLGSLRDDLDTYLKRIGRSPESS